MDPVPGYAIASWERGYGDFGLRPDLAHPAPDPLARGHGDGAVRRRVARREARRAVAAPGAEGAGREGAARSAYEPMFGSELEFFLFRETYLEAHAKHYHDLTPSVPYILDYHILAASYDEPFLRAVRHVDEGGRAWRRVVEGRGVGRPARDQLPLTRTRCKTADDHVVYKTGLKEIAHQRGCSVTFMAKPRPRLGRLLVPHPLLALARRRGRVRRRVGRLPALPRRPDRLRWRELAIFYAPTINSYKRFAAGSWAPTTLAWALRQPDVRLPRRRPRLVAAAGDADSRRRREPVPRVRGAAGGRAVRDRGEARARAGVRGERVRVGRGAVPARAARRDRPARVEHASRGSCSATR